MGAPKEDDSETNPQDYVSRTDENARRPPYERHLLVRSDASHALLNETLVLNPDELREELGNAMGTPTAPGQWMPEESDDEDIFEDDLLPEDIARLGRPRDPSAQVELSALEAGIVNTFHRDATVTAHERQSKSKISNYVMGVSQRIAGPALPKMTRLDSSRFYKNNRSSLDGSLSLGPRVSRVRSRQSTVGNPRGPSLDQKPITSAMLHTQPIDIASLTETAPCIDYSYYLYGNSLFLFSPQSRIRRFCYKVVSHWLMNPAILTLIFLQTALLAYRQWNPHDNSGYLHLGYNWGDYAICVINFLYTIEITIKIIAFGLINDKIIFATLGLKYPRSKISFFINFIWKHVWANVSFWKSKTAKIQNRTKSSPTNEFPKERRNLFKKYLNATEIEMLDLGRTPSSSSKSIAKEIEIIVDNPISIFSDDEEPEIDVPLKERWEFDKKLALMNINRAYLRTNGNRLDFTSVVCFWISLPLSLSGWDTANGFMFFRAMAAIRIFRLCNLTHGTNFILQMFQSALPQLIDVGIFISCFWVLFGIIGVQSFLSSFTRQCVWHNPDNEEETFLNKKQYCGSYLAANGTRLPYLDRANSSYPIAKGFECPINSVCQSGQNPFNGTVSFDNVLQSMQLVFVIMSINTFAELMYQMMDTDGLLASLFFIFGIFILTVWLMNLFIAIIVTSFHNAHEQHKHSSRERNPKPNAFSAYWPLSSKFRGARTQTVIDRKPLLKIYYRFEILFILLVFADLIVQCFRAYGMSTTRAHALYRIEAAFTCVFLGEILVRFVLYLPYWRTFFLSKKNLFDLFLAVITSIIILGPVKAKLGQAYYWLTAFQLMRFYRVAFAFRWTGDLLSKVLRNIRAIFDLALFYFILLGVSGIVVGRFFEGTVPEADLEEIIYTMHTLPNTWMSLYVITSTAGWANIMYGLQTYAKSTLQRSIGSIMLVLWFIISNFVVIHIFIAIIEHALSAADEGQKVHQLKKFIKDMTKRLLTARLNTGYLRKLKEKIFKSNREKSMDSTLSHLLLSGSAVNEFADKVDRSDESEQSVIVEERERADYYVARTFNKVKSVVMRPFQNPFYSHKIEIPESEVFDPSKFASQIIQERKKLIVEQDEYLKKHPTFNYVFYLLSPRHPMRRLCQKIVKLSHGERIDGVNPNLIVSDIFSVIMFLSSILVVVTACYLTPLRRRSMVMNGGVWNWGVYVDFAFLLIFGIEFLIKITADGLIYTPNAYVRSPWNCLDFAALASMFIEFIAFIISNGKLSRIIRGLKALRALRLLTISETAKNNFHYTMISGFGKILSAALVAIALLFPFSIWGLNVFNGRLGHCNNHLMSQAQCFNEFENEVYDWEVLSPMVYSTPFLQMNSFRKSFSTFYQITSLEGWPELLQDVMKSTGIGTPQHLWASPFNGFLIVLFNFVSTVFILTLFVSVIIHNYSKLTGRAYLTESQIQWYHIKKYLNGVRASKRRDESKLNMVSRLCYKMTIGKNRIWQSLLNIALLIHLIDLLLEAFPAVVSIDVRYEIFIFTTLCFALDSIMRLIGAGSKIFFSNKWYVFGLIVNLVAFITTTLLFKIAFDNVFWNFNKLFLIGILMYLFPRSDRLTQLLMFASESFPNLLSMMFTWLIMFIVYAIATNQIFGMTKLGINTTSNMNFRTIPKALIFLFRMSFGENWNIIMEDFTLEPPFCIFNENSEESDCGSKPYAYILFMSWNIISMYIMLNLFISLIIDTFSYIAGGSEYAHLIKRSEVRKFKRTWQIYDPTGTGFIDKSDLRDFLRTLRGALKVEEFQDVDTSIKNLSSHWFQRTNSADPYELSVDFDAINSFLHDNRDESHRRSVFREEFIEEALMSMELKGVDKISFNSLILQIPLFTSFDGDQCLILADFLERRLLQKRVLERLNKKRARNVLRTYACRWKYLQYKQKKILKEEFHAKTSQ